MKSPQRVTALIAALWMLSAPIFAAGAEKNRVRAEIRDSVSGAPLAARLYVQNEAGKFFFARAADPQGKAVEYRKQYNERTVEMHTAVSAHPLELDLPAGTYELTVERGKEYLPLRRQLVVGNEPQSIELKLQRWIDMARYGWYSGETHVHRALDELPTAMLADDLNVALPLTYWVTKSHTPPAQGDKNAPPVRAELITVDPTHVIYPLNTEYEIFTVGGKPHTLGAVFALNHRTVLPQGVPPVGPVAQQVHSEGGLLELDKHNWPWSMMLVPVMKVDLYELANNHHWRTEFFFRKFGETVPEYMRLPRRDDGLTEADWTEFGWKNYYALLNCGYRLRPTAGTASGVHPVPLGFGRVYVHLPEGFSYEAWLKGLNAGRSFVTTGPLLFAQVNDADPGHTFTQEANRQSYRVSGVARSSRPLAKLEIISAGDVAQNVLPVNTPLPQGGFESEFDVTFELAKSTWLAVRCQEANEDGRFRFAHTAPFYIDQPRRPLRPRKAEVEYLVQRVDAEIRRNTGVLGEEALAEFREARDKYRALLETARED